jgi:hypothetical protein
MIFLNSICYFSIRFRLRKTELHFSVSYGCNGGSVVTANETYFSSDQVSSSFSGQCQLQYCSGSSACQLRLDFQTMVIAGPYSDPLAGENINLCRFKNW